MTTWTKTKTGYAAEFERAGKFTAKARPDGYFDLYHGRKKVAEKVRLKAAKAEAEKLVGEIIHWQDMARADGPRLNGDPRPTEPIKEQLEECYSNPRPLPAPTANSEATLPASDRVELPETAEITGTPRQVAGVVGMPATAESAEVEKIAEAMRDHCDPYVIEVSPHADPAAVERVMKYATPLIGHAAMSRRDAQTDGAEDMADQAAKAEEEGVTFRIRRDDCDDYPGYHAHVSRPGRPGLQTDSYVTEEAARAAVLKEFPKAVEDDREQKRLDMLGRAAVLADTGELRRSIPMPGAERRVKAFRVGRGLKIKPPLGRAF